MQTCATLKRSGNHAKTHHFFAVSPDLKATIYLYGHLQCSLSNHQLFKRCKAHTIILWLFPQAGTYIQHASPLQPEVLIGLMPCPSDILRKQRERRIEVFFPYVAFFHLFLCRLSLVYRHIVRFANCLFPPPLSCVFQQFFLPVLSTLPFQFFILTFLGEYPRFPMDSGTDLKSILTKGNLSISAVDRNRISRTGGWHIWCLLPQHRTLTGIWQLCPICWFLSLQRYSSFVGLVCVS